LWKCVGKHARIGNSSCSPVPTPILVPTPCDPSSLIHYMPKFMRPFIENIVDVKGGVICGFMDIAE